MTRDEAKALIHTIESFVVTGPVRAVGPLEPAVKTPAGVAEARGTFVKGDGHVSRQFPNVADENLYQMFKARFIDEAKIDPILLRLIMVQPEILIEIEKRTVTLDGGVLKGRIARLLAAGWFTEARATGAVRKELARTGPDPGGGGNLAANLSDLRRDGFLVSEGDGWVAAPGIKITEKQIASA